MTKGRSLRLIRTYIRPAATSPRCSNPPGALDAVRRTQYRHVGQRAHDGHILDGLVGLAVAEVESPALDPQSTYRRVGDADRVPQLVLGAAEANTAKECIEGDLPASAGWWRPCPCSRHFRNSVQGTRPSWGSNGRLPGRPSRAISGFPPGEGEQGVPHASRRFFWSSMSATPPARGPRAADGARRGPRRTARVTCWRNAALFSANATPLPFTATR